MMVILATWSYSGVRAPTTAWPASWYATSSWRCGVVTGSFLVGPIMMRSMASSTSSMVISFFLRRAVKMAASLRTFLSDAPDMPGVRREIMSMSMSEERGLPRAWTRRISERPAKSGRSTMMRRSKRPGRRSAWSRTSARLVAAMTMMPGLPSKPSISTSIWLRVCSRSSLPPATPAPRWRPTASISSMKMIQGAFFLAWPKRSRTRAAPTPTNISTNSEPEMEKKGTPASPATARARSVLPVPGGPSRMTPRGILAPSWVKRSGSFRNWTTSSSSSLAWGQPATSLKVVPVCGVIMTFAFALPTPMGPPGPNPPGPPGKPPPAPPPRVSRKSPPNRIAGKIRLCKNAPAPESCAAGSTVTSTLCSVSVRISSGSLGSASSRNLFPSTSTARIRSPSAENVTFSTLSPSTAEINSEYRHGCVPFAPASICRAAAGLVSVGAAFVIGAAGATSTAAIAGGGATEAPARDAARARASAAFFEEEDEEGGGSAAEARSGVVRGRRASGRGRPRRDGVARKAVVEFMMWAECGANWSLRRVRGRRNRL
mmetsp:Transcript_12107/g.30585  ORF Transcript_12107/g.30585 Transcript_12107/m.30585 type:complete len:544 (+) Transcript_12107:169-1800(+)